VIELKEHAVAHRFPDMTEAEQEALALDIRDHGQRVPILLYQGKIADGKHRYAVLKALDREPLTIEFKGTEEELLDAVVSLNLKRRHLTPAQRDVLAWELKPHYAKAAAARLAAAGKIGGQSKKKGEASLAPSGATLGKAAAQAAKAAGSSERSVERVEQIHKTKGGDAVIAQMKAGTIKTTGEGLSRVTKPKAEKKEGQNRFTGKDAAALFDKLQKALNTKDALDILLELKDQKFDVQKGLDLVRALAGWLRASHGVKK
jgi:hypothetical protein